MTEVSSPLAAAETTDAPDKASPFRAMLLVICVRAVIIATGVVSVATASNPTAFATASGKAWMAWDGRHYQNILENGYAPAISNDTSNDPGQPHFYTIAFFPLFPIACKPLAMLMDPAVAMVIVGNCCSIAGLFFLYLWARKLFGEPTALIATLLCATYPAAVFFSAGETEGMFFMFAACTLWLLQKERFCWAAAAAALATATRPTGVALALLVPLYAWICTPNLPFARRARMFIALGIAASLGAIAYELFLWHRYGRPDVYLMAQAFWVRAGDEMVHQQAVAGMKRYSLQFFISRLTLPQAWNRGIGVIVLIITIVGFFKPTRIPRLFFLLPLIIFLMTYLPNHGLRASSVPRYESAAAPIFLLAAVWLARKQYRPTLIAVLCAQFFMQAYYAILFSRGLWVG